MPLAKSTGEIRGLTNGKLVFALGVVWSIFQLYVATPLPYVFTFAELNEAQQRPVHLAFALVLAFLSHGRGEKRVALITGANVLFALAAAVSCLYLVVNYREVIANAGGKHSPAEVTASVIGILCLIEAARRFCGIGLAGVAALFIAYAFAGPYMPGLLAHAGVSLSRLVDHLWLTNEGIFGITLAVSNDLIFLFVLFGALLEKAGAGRYFIELALSLVGHLRGGPGKACVVSSALFGMISGSSLANLMTVGTFTIPLMKRAGFTPEKAGAIETCSSINGQLMPPVMGAAAFIMAEYLGIPYSQIIKHAFLPATIAYITLYYIVHVESEKLDMPALARKGGPASRRERIRTGALAVLGFCAALGAIAGLAALLEALPGRSSLYAAALVLGGLYVYLLKKGQKYRSDDPEGLDVSGEVTLPEFVPTLLSGLYYFIPVGILVWCLMVARLSPQTAVVWGILATVVIVVTKRGAIGLLVGRAKPMADVRTGLADLVDAFANGARNMIGVALALGTAGIVVGVVSQTGLGMTITGVIEAVSGTNLVVTLLMTALICVILGMGLPTTANYIVVVALMVTPITVLGQRAGLVIPPIAVHLFVFYYGLLAGTTPPVAVDAFAAAAVARSNPMRTALQAFVYDLRTSTLPFIFVFNTEILLIGIDNAFEFMLVAATAVIGMIAFAGVLQNYFIVRNRRWEALILLCVSFMLLRPDFFRDLAFPPFRQIDPGQFEQLVARSPEGAQLRLRLEGTNISSDRESRVLLVSLGAEGQDGRERLRQATGMALAGQDGRIVASAVLPTGPAQRVGIRQGWEVTGIEAHNEQPNKRWLYVPTLLLAGIIAALQFRRRRVVKGGRAVGTVAGRSAA